MYPMQPPVVHSRSSLALASSQPPGSRHCPSAASPLFLSSTRAEQEQSRGARHTAWCWRRLATSCLCIKANPTLFTSEKPKFVGSVMKKCSSFLQLLMQCLPFTVSNWHRCVCKLRVYCSTAVQHGGHSLFTRVPLA